jgi:hypothetical protein
MGTQPQLVRESVGHVDVAIGWYPDPARPDIERYWNGTQWTDERLVTGAAPPAAVIAAPVRSTVGFELPSYEDLARMGVDAPAGTPEETSAGEGAHTEEGGSTEKPKRTGTRRALRALSVVLGAAVVAIGSFIIVGRHSDANAAVVAAVNSALAGHSADISLTGSGSAAGSSFSITGTGSIDFTQNTAQVSVDLADGAQQVSEQVMYDNKVIYVNLGSAIGQIFPGKSWVSLSLSQLSPTGGVSSLGSGTTFGSDPAAALQTLRQEGNTATDLGPSTVDGASVEGYSVHITNPDLDYRAYVNSAGQLVRLTADVHATLAGQSVHEADTVDFSNYGAPVSVTPPPAVEVAPFQTFLNVAMSLSAHSTD